MTEYESFDLRAENPTRWQSVLNNPDPMVKGDPCAVFFVCIIGLILFGLVVGLVPWFTMGERP